MILRYVALQLLRSNNLWYTEMLCTFRSICAVPDMAVCCNYLMLRFPGMLFRYFLSDFDIVPLSPMSFIFYDYIRCIFVVRASYFKIFRFHSFIFH